MDEDFARHYWPNASAIGQRLWEGPEAGKDAEAFTVVGVVGGTKQAGLTEDVFRTDDSFFVTVRTSLAPESLGLALQKAVRQSRPRLTVHKLRSKRSRLGMAGQRCGSLGSYDAGCKT